MRRAVRAVGGLCLTLLAACAGTTTALEPQHKPLGGNLARIYVLRPNPHINVVTAGIPIIVDGKTVGSLATDSYFFVDRPPGRHTLSIAGASEIDVEVRSGEVKYLEVGQNPYTLPAPGYQFLQRALANTGGDPLPGRNNSPLIFYSLDASAGPAAVAKLKAARAQ